MMTNAKSDKSADGIGLVDARQKKFLRKIPAGSDPEQFRAQLATARAFTSPMRMSARRPCSTPSAAKLITFIPVSREPEGVGRQS